jgi:hypothetical protein
VGDLAQTLLPAASVWEEIAAFYERGVIAPGKQPQLFALLAFLITFGIVRLVTHSIRRGVGGLGNVSMGGLHIHHLVWGILLLLVVGYIGVAFEPPSPWEEVLAILFGVGAALTLDEFALWLNLRDVYWSHEGRRSIDAVIVAATLSGLVLFGFQIWSDVAVGVEEQVEEFVAGAGVFGVAVALINAIKGKPFMAVATFLIVPVGIVGAVRLAHPRSPWARLYSEQRLAKATTRYDNSRWGKRREARRQRKAAVAGPIESQSA